MRGFDHVRRIARNLEGVEEGTAYGSPCLRVGGHMFACIAINKSAEPNSLMIVLSSFDQRDDLIAEQPPIYYSTPHYDPYPCVLVRLGRVGADALRDLLLAAWRQASARRPKSARKSASKTARKRTRAAR